LLPR
jgi:hypothetical protein